MERKLTKQSLQQAQEAMLLRNRRLAQPSKPRIFMRDVNKQAHLVGERCQCGKALHPAPHCPACGSTNIYSKDAANIELDVSQGQLPGLNEDVIVIAGGFMCRKCKLEFNELMPCEAPRFESVSMKKKRQEEAALESLMKIGAEGGRKAMIAEALRRGGINPGSKYNSGESTTTDNKSSIVDDTKPIEDYEDKFFKQD